MGHVGDERQIPHVHRHCHVTLQLRTVVVVVVVVGAGSGRCGFRRDGDAEGLHGGQEHDLEERSGARLGLQDEFQFHRWGDEDGFLEKPMAPLVYFSDAFQTRHGL